MDIEFSIPPLTKSKDRKGSPLAAPKHPTKVSVSRQAEKESRMREAKNMPVPFGCLLPSVCQ